jgi:hypothetical protein
MGEYPLLRVGSTLLIENGWVLGAKSGEYGVVPGCLSSRGDLLSVEAWHVLMPCCTQGYDKL